MRTINFLFAAAVGALAYHIWRKSTEKSMGKQLTAEEQAQIVSDVIVDESQKYSDVLKKQYDIIMLPNKLSNKVKAKAQELTRGRYEINLNKVKEPVTI
jgi:hypothetical protein